MVGRDPAQCLGQEVEPLLDVHRPKKSRTNLPASSGHSASAPLAAGRSSNAARSTPLGMKQIGVQGARPRRCPISGRERACRHDARRRFFAFDQRHVHPLLPALVAEGPRLGHAVGGDQVGDACRAGRAGARRVWACQSPCKWTTSADRTDASRSVSGPLSVNPAGDRNVIQPRRCGRDDRDSAAQPRRGPRSFPECSEPSRHRAPGPVRCRDAPSHFGPEADWSCPDEQRDAKGEGIDSRHVLLSWFCLAFTAGEPERTPGASLRIQQAVLSDKRKIIRRRNSTLPLPVGEGRGEGRSTRKCNSQTRSSFKGDGKRFEGTLSEPVGAPMFHGLRRSFAHKSAILIGQGGHPGQLVRDCLHVQWVKSASGRAIGLRNQHGAQPARAETSSGTRQAAASLTTSPQGSERLGSTNAPACAYHFVSASA